MGGFSSWGQWRTHYPQPVPCLPSEADRRAAILLRLQLKDSGIQKQKPRVDFKEENKVRGLGSWGVRSPCAKGGSAPRSRRKGSSLHAKHWHKEQGMQGWFRYWAESAREDTAAERAKNPQGPGIRGSQVTFRAWALPLPLRHLFQSRVCQLSREKYNWKGLLHICFSFALQGSGLSSTGAHLKGTKMGSNLNLPLTSWACWALNQISQTAIMNVKNAQHRACYVPRMNGIYDSRGCGHPNR